MRFFRLFVATLLLVGTWLSAMPAQAAGTITFALPTWSNRAGTNRKIDVLNRQDCLNDATATFSVTVRSVSSNAQLEVWAGTGCETLANRTGTTKTCVQVSAGGTAANVRTVVARLQDMVKPYGSTDTGTAASCDLEASTGLTSRNLYFVVYNTGTTMSEVTMTPAWAFKFDVKAPAPPTGVTAGSGEQSLVPSFTPPSGESNLLKYHFYCSPVTGAAVTDGTAGSAGTGGTSSTALQLIGGAAGTDTGGTAGTDTGGTAGTDTGGTAGTDTGGTDGTDTAGAGSGGTDTTGTSGTAGSAGTAGTASVPVDPNCNSTILIPGEPPSDKAIDCGSIGASAAKSGETAQVLENGTTYAVAVATEDDANNIGVLSQLACGTPQDVTGFFEAYRESGGQAGGGYCTFTPARNGAASLLAAFLIAACAFWRRRR